MTSADIDVRFDCIGPGYGKLSEGGIEAIETLARTEGILLDPMYSGKALAGLMADVRAGRYRAGESIVLIHTGGTPALFAYAEGIVDKMHPRRIS